MIRECVVKKSARLSDNTPWIYSNEIVEISSKVNLEKASYLRFDAADGSKSGIATYNKHSLIAMRVLSWNIAEEINTEWFHQRLLSAMEKREFFYPGGCYRWVYGEADGLPGLVIDRYDQLAVVEVNSAGMEKMIDLWKSACLAIKEIKCWIIKRDSQSRNLEKLEVIEEPLVWGDITFAKATHGVENSVKFWIDPIEGQKTGWFYDQRENRKVIQRMVKPGMHVCDLYTHTGAFGLYAAQMGATSVLAVDRSAHALEIAAKNAELNGLTNISFKQSEVFNFLEKTDEVYDLLVVDPPAFIKGKKTYDAGIMGYKKLLTLSCQHVKRNGILCFTSCSYGLTMDDIHEVLKKAFVKSRRNGYIVARLGLGHDHPILPQCPEMDYLKGVIVQFLD
ncbi:MAG: class I SAM-dependent rRNA methyltransferase [Gammaproteobacteria bacterium]|nr:class I SAM-dependent rRNA methyltransferase [Gammaproteobacteria bacterium]